MADSRRRGRSAQAALARLLAGENLRRGETEELFGDLIDGEMTAAMQAAILVALAAKGEAVAEIAGAAAAMRRRAVPVASRRAKIVDTCGTGGDCKGTFNVSTAAALVAAAAGVPVAKHGNRSVSSRSGSADVLEALGVDISPEPERSAKALDEIGIAFLFAPRLHPAMREVMPVRRQLGVRTIFNILGPLTNPARARRQLLGVYEDRLVEIVAEVLIELGCDHALVVRGSDGLDELTTTASSLVAEVRDGRLDTYRLDPESLGLRRAEISELVGGGPAENAELLLGVLEGRPGALQDITALNAGAAIYVGGRAASLRDGVEAARAALRCGAAGRKLDELRRFSGRADD